MAVKLGIAENEVVALSGDLNHNELAALLDRRLAGERRDQAFSMHYLWYRWRNNMLVLSGAASETAESFEELKKYFAGKKELLLRKLTRL